MSNGTEIDDAGDELLPGEAEFYLLAQAIADNMDRLLVHLDAGEIEEVEEVKRQMRSLQLACLRLAQPAESGERCGLA